MRDEICLIKVDEEWLVPLYNFYYYFFCSLVSYEDGDEKTLLISMEIKLMIFKILFLFLCFGSRYARSSSFEYLRWSRKKKNVFEILLHIKLPIASPFPQALSLLWFDSILLNVELDFLIESTELNGWRIWLLINHTTSAPCANKKSINQRKWEIKKKCYVIEREISFVSSNVFLKKHRN